MAAHNLKSLTLGRATLLTATVAACAAGAMMPTMRAGAAQPDTKGRKMLVYIGTYTQRGSEGIYRFQLDTETGALTAPMVAAKTPNPSFLALHPSGRYLYACNETTSYQGTKSGSISAFAVDPNTGDLTFLNQQSSRGGAPCHVVVDKLGKNVLVANYVGGNVASLPVQADGKLGEATGFVQHQGSSVNPRRQESPHAHSINLDAANRFAFAADLGLDKVLIYRFDSATGNLTPNTPGYASVDPGSGPRHFTFHPSGKFAYVINEMLSTVTMFHYNAEKGALDRIQAITTLPDDFKGNTSTAEVQVHPSGKFLYGSNRGHDSIAIFTIDPSTGLLRKAGHQSTGGKTPRNFGIDPSGKFLLAANQDSGTVNVFRIDASTGALTPTGHSAQVPMPVCVKFVTPAE